MVKKMANPSYKDLYELVDDRTSEIMAKFDTLEQRVGRLESWKGELTGRITVAVGVVMFFVYFLADVIKQRLKI